MIAPKELNLGDIVISVSGRDKKRYYVIMCAENGFVGICDGDLHKISKIKKKNIKHIKPTGCNSSVIREKLEKGEEILDAEIRREIAEFEKQI